MSNNYIFALKRLIFLAGLMLTLTQQLPGQQRKTWTGAVNSSWSNGSNWNPVGAPGPTDDVRFDQTSAVNCTVNINPMVRSLEARSNYGGTISLGSQALTVGGDFDIASASQFSSGAGSKVVVNASGDIDCAASIYRLEINTPSNGVIDVRSPLTVTILTITQVGILDGDGLRVLQQIINNDPDLDGDCFLAAAGATTFTGNPIRLLEVEAGTTLQLLSGLTLERDFELIGDGNILGGGTLTLGGEGKLDFSGAVLANVIVNTSDPSHNILLSEDFTVSGNLTFTQVGEFLGIKNIRAGSDITVNDPDIGSQPSVVATGTGNLSGSGTLSKLAVETGATLNLASDFTLKNSFELTGGGTISGPHNLILGSTGNIDFAGTVSNVEIKMPGTRGHIRMEQAFNISGNLTVTSAVNLTSNEIRVSGNIIITDDEVSGTAHLVMAGGGTTTFQGAGNGIYPVLVVDKNNAADRAQLNSSDEFSEIEIRRGVLDLNGQNPYAGVATIESNGTLGGVGTLEGDVEGPGKVSPGNSTGTMTIIGNLDISGTLVMEITGPGQNNGGTAGSDFDQLIVIGNSSVGTLSVLFIGTIGPTFPITGDIYLLVSATGANTNGGFTITPSNINASYGLGILIISSPAFPVELLYFSAEAKGQAVLLEWATATERNNDYMAVERSADGIRFKEAGRLKGAGTTQERQEYSFTDERPLPGLNYYRLRQVDYDGAIEYHKTVSVLFDNKEEGLQLLAFPNPASSTLQARWAAAADQPATLRLSGANGQMAREYQAPAGTGAYELPLEGLPAGLFFLQVKQGEKVEVIRVIKE